MTYTEEQFSDLANSFNESTKGYVKRIEELREEKAEMLEALKRARLLLGIALNASDYADAVATIEAAIKKTEGEE